MRKIGPAIAGVVVVLGLSVAVVGCNSSTAGGDKMGGGKMSGDKMAGDKMGGEKMNEKPGG